MRSIVLSLVIATAPAGAAFADDLAGLDWVAGRWTETRDGVTTTETWTLGADGLSGVGETQRAGKPKRVEEQMTIRAAPAGVTFTATLPGQAPVGFVRLPGPTGEAVFENKAHDFPQRVIYRRCGDDLCARIEGLLKGKLEGQDWRFVRVK